MSSSTKVNKSKPLTATGSVKQCGSPPKDQPVIHKENLKLDLNRPLGIQIHTNQDYNPTWIDLWHDIEAEFGGLIKSLEQAYFQLQISLNVGLNPALSNAEWHTFLTGFRSEIALLNLRVSEYNIQVPLPTFQKPLFEADSIITKLPNQAG
ncbi:MAG: hypothetical protein WBV22_09980 [Anaerolineaceae bacterium]